MLDLDVVQARLAAAAAAVSSAVDSIEGEWGDGTADDVRDAARFLGADIYVFDFDGVELPALVAELRAAREVIEIARHADAPGLRAAIHAYDWHAPEEPTP